MIAASRRGRVAALAIGLMLTQLATASSEEFHRAWKAASVGDRATFQQIKPTLAGYSLYPYLQYEDYRARQSSVDADEMAAFLAAHSDWAFADGLKTSWLRTLGRTRQWDALLKHGSESQDTRVRCYLARGRIAQGQTDGLVQEVQSLWAAGRSQPDECDPAFKWLRDQGGITPGLAWMRIGLVIEARNPRMLRYLARYLPADERKWAEYWLQQEREGYRRLDKASKWPDAEQARDIIEFGIGRLARSRPDDAAVIFDVLRSRFQFSPEQRAAMLRDLAIWSAVDLSIHTSERVWAVPEAYRDGQVLEWWARFGLASRDWHVVDEAIGAMPDELRSDSRWRYWRARARLSLGESDLAGADLEGLAGEANYYGFLAADALQRPYAICPEEPTVSNEARDAFLGRSVLGRAIELRNVGLKNWARAEWQLALRGFDREGLRHAAAVAIAEGWHEMAIIALGNSGDTRWYDWRFPLDHLELVEGMISGSGMDASWVLGLMRSESAMAEDAISSAGARGLMQVMPATAKQLARQHGLPYSGKQQLLQGPDNVRFGTLHLQSLLDDFQNNPVLATGAYNAGAAPVKRWLNDRRLDDTAIWVDTLSYFETRDYIPRVLAFTVIYDWRTGRDVRRISSRMPKPDSGSMISGETTEVACPAS